MQDNMDQRKSSSSTVLSSPLPMCKFLDKQKKYITWKCIFPEVLTSFVFSKVKIAYNYNSQFLHKEPTERFFNINVALEHSETMH